MIAARFVEVDQLSVHEPKTDVAKAASRKRLVGFVNRIRDQALRFAEILIHRVLRIKQH